MANKSIALVVITPERQVLEETVDAVVIPAHDGEIGILSDRAPLMCELGIGQLRYQQGGVTQRLFVDGGFAQVIDNRVAVLTTRAQRAQDITAEVVTAAERAAAERSGFAKDARLAHEQAQRRASVLRSLRG
jgi:F-type H+-transporting ATPase subunit epsilon